MHFFTISSLLLCLVFSTVVSCQNMTAASQSTTGASSPIFTLPSSSTSYLTRTPVLGNVTTSTASNGATTVVAATPTFLYSNFTSVPKVIGEYRLRTQTTNNKQPRFNNLWVGAWSVTQGFSADAALTSNRSEAVRFYQNGTNEQLDFGGNSSFWGLNVDFDTISSRWYSVSTHTPVGYSYGTFYLNGTGLQWTPNTSPPPHTGLLGEFDLYFGGWMACDWWHGIPQLFYKVGFFNDTNIPCGCAQVLLLQDYPR